MELHRPQHREDVMPPGAGHRDDHDLVVREAGRAEHREAKHGGDGKDAGEDHPRVEGVVGRGPRRSRRGRTGGVIQMPLNLSPPPYYSTPPWDYLHTQSYA